MDANRCTSLSERLPFQGHEEEEFARLLRFLDDQLRLVFIDGNMVKRRRKAFEYYFENLSVIPDQKSYKVIDTASNNFVGTLDEEFIASHGEAGSSFIVKGRPWKILSVEDGKVSCREWMTSPLQCLDGRESLYLCPLTSLRKSER
jgi:ATP-dependent Lhr-like helicase